jgi:hypothetical protein
VEAGENDETPEAKNCTASIKGKLGNTNRKITKK